ncbi:MAG: hypothetical protein KF688_17925 [Pirellulales bacterium]|nr:hypothetical protein [Pirellulales bacterium]
MNQRRVGKSSRRATLGGSCAASVSLAGALVAAVLTTTASASDHADPIDPLYLLRQEGAITDLFVFPVLQDGTPAFPFARTANLPLHDTLADSVREELTSDEQGQIDSLVFILCVRRQLTDSGTLELSPYEYRIHVDASSDIEYPNEAAFAATSPAPAPASDSMPGDHVEERISLVEAFVRYGGRVAEPNAIKEDLDFAFRLNNDGSLRPGYPKRYGPGNSPTTGTFICENEATFVGERIAGIYDDPFIFPTFFDTNVVAMAIRIPMSEFPSDNNEFVIWATSHKGDTQVDHVGRSLRTQNPRFDLLNPLHPSKHVEAITDARRNPGLMRDILLRLNFASYYAYRKWDYEPDVMCLTTKYRVGFPNGRLVTDDVAAILAQHGDTLLYELSFQDEKYQWPRQKTNDGIVEEEKAFSATFPYLRGPNPESPQKPPRRLSRASVVKLLLIATAIFLFWLWTHWFFARWYHRRKLRRRYL